MTEAYPLQWPEGRPRTRRRETARFATTFAAARDALLEEISRLGGTHAVLSSNLELRRDGLPYANQRQPDDPGIAVYFMYKGRQQCFACDRWTKTHDNMQAIRKTIEALRGIARWGTGDMMDAAFSGFVQLEQRPSDAWWVVLSVDRNASPGEIRAAYKRKAHTFHPDRPGGSTEEFQRVHQAYQQATA